MTDILKEYKILSILGVPFFAVKNEEEREELQSMVKIKLKEITNLTLISEPEMTRAEKYFDDLSNRRRKLKKGSIKDRMLVLVEGALVFYLVIKHFVIRIGVKKLICEEEIRMFYETATESVEHYREKKIKKLAGIK